MRLRFRSTFLLTLLTLVSVTVFLVGITSYYSAKITARELSGQVLDQTSARVDKEVDDLTAAAAKVSRLNKRLIETGLTGPREFTWLVPYWAEVLRGEPGLTSVFVGVEATGESSGVSRLGEKLSVWETNRDAASGKQLLREYWPEAYPRTPYAFDPDKPGPDIRSRPWYVGARDAKHAIWTDTYTFLGVKGSEAVAGVTYATPLYGESGEFVGALTADFGLNRLSEFLATVRVAKTGFACVIETRADGSRHLIAHPAGAKDDPRVRALLSANPNARGFTPLEFEVNGETYLGGVRALSGDDAPLWQVGVVVPQAEVLARVTRSNRISIGIALAGLLVALGCGLYVATQVARPLEALSHEMAAISRLDLGERPINHSIIIEVDRVAVATEQIKTGLRQKRVLEKYVPKGAREDIEENRAGDVALGGERVRRTILFSDLRGFTSMSERLAPDAVVRLLNQYLEKMTGVILAHGGDINEYIGDAVLAVFTTPTDAVRAAIAMQLALAQLREETDDPEVRSLRMGIGVHVGDVVEGNIGTTERVKFGVVGDTVNLAARIQDKSREGTRTWIYVSAAVRDEATAITFESVGELAMKGKAEPVAVFEVAA
jgi:adenylate cyclase